MTGSIDVIDPPDPTAPTLHPRFHFFLVAVAFERANAIALLGLNGAGVPDVVALPAVDAGSEGSS